MGTESIAKNLINIAEGDNISKEDTNKMYFSQITDMPLPSKSKIILDNTVIVGKNENWMGRLTLTHNASIDELFTFFVNEMPKFDFEEKSSVICV